MSFTGNIRKTPFFILIATQREMHQSKKAQRKNLACLGHIQKGHAKVSTSESVIWLCCGHKLKSPSRYFKHRQL